MKSVDKKALLILGVHQNSEAYPNTCFRTRWLRESGVFETAEINVPLTAGRLGNPGGLLRKLLALARGTIAHVLVLSRFLLSKETTFVYVPYPAVFMVFLLSLLPSRGRSRRIVVDAFISVYDTVVNDRKLINRNGLVAKILFLVERRAYAFASRVVVDTRQSADFVRDLFQLDPGKVIAIPLATDESNFQPKPYVLKSTGLCRVLFVGTLIPLHGIETILEAAAILAGRRDIVFRIVGDGQEAGKIEQWKSRHDIPLQWVREWQTSEQVSNEIEHADICLGIFGAGDKTQRVCPFKMYAYAALGRPIVTGCTVWANEVLTGAGERYFDTVPIADPLALANKISQLAEDAEARKLLARNSRRLYEERLSNKLANEQLASCILSS